MPTIVISKSGSKVSYAVGGTYPKEFKGKEDVNYKFTDATHIEFNLSGHKKSFELSEVTIEGVVPADEAAAVAALEEVFLDAGTSASTTANIDSVSEFSTLDGEELSVVVLSDAKQGGTFTKYDGVYPADNGMVFTDMNGQKWKRQATENFIDLNWYGVVAVNNQSNDIFAKITAAIAAASSTEFLSSPSLFIPGAPTGYWYYCTQKITITTKIRIFGIGYNSHIRFHQNVGGLKFDYTTSRYSIVHDFRITQYGSVGTITIGTNFGIECKDIIYGNNIVINGFGDGLMAWNDSGAVDSTLGNSNNMRWTNCDFSSNYRHGVYLRGADSNNSIFHDCNYVGNGGCGHFDKSFLGNSVSFPHFATNGSPEIAFQRGLVTFGGVTWASIVDDNLNNSPVEGAFWTSLGSLWSVGFPFVLPWNSATNYYAVGSYNSDGANQYGTLIQIYHEADQAPPYAGPGVKVLGKNVTFRNETSVAALNAANGSLFTRAPFWVGLPGGSSTLRGYMSSSAVGLQHSANEALLFGYNTASKYGYISTNNAETSGGVWFTTTGTTAATLGRTTGTGANGNLALSSFAFVSMANSRSTFRKFDVTNSYSPSTSGLDYGDFFMLTNTIFTGPKPEAIMSKFLEPTVAGTKRLFTIKGYQEDTLTNVTGTHTVGIDYNIALNRGILYDIQFAGSNTTDDCILHRQILCVNRGGTVTVVNNTAVRADYVPGTYSGAAITLTITGGDDINVTITGLPAGTNGKVHVKRIDY